MGCLGMMLLFGLAIAIAVMSPRRDRPEAATTSSPAPGPTPPQPSAPTSVVAVAPSDALAPGTIVEVATVLVAADRSVFDSLKAGADPSTFQNRAQKFGVTPGTRARVIEQDGDAVHVRLEDGNWKGRDGWVARQHARKPPTEDESSGDTKFGLTLAQRREVYGLLHQIGMYAGYEADRRVPTDLKDRNAAAFTKAQKRHLEVSETTAARLREKLRVRYPGLTTEQMDAIDAEGSQQKWPMPEFKRGDPPPV